MKRHKNYLHDQNKYKTIVLNNIESKKCVQSSKFNQHNVRNFKKSDKTINKPIINNYQKIKPKCDNLNFNN